MAVAQVVNTNLGKPALSAPSCRCLLILWCVNGNMRSSGAAPLRVHERARLLFEERRHLSETYAHLEDLEGAMQLGIVLHLLGEGQVLLLRPKPHLARPLLAYLAKPLHGVADKPVMVGGVVQYRVELVAERSEVGLRIRRAVLLPRPRIRSWQSRMSGAASSSIRVSPR